jgi:hypothetical protein
MNLLSVGQVTNQNCFAGFDDSSYFIQDLPNGQVIWTSHHLKPLFGYSNSMWIGVYWNELGWILTYYGFKPTQY